MTWEPTGQNITDSRIFGDFDRPLPGTVPPLQDNPEWDSASISTCPICNMDREIENVLVHRSEDKAEEMSKGEPENGLENDAEPGKEPGTDPKIPPPSHQTIPIPNDAITTPKRATIFINHDFFLDSATGRTIARGDRPCDLNPDDPRTRFVKERGSPDTEKIRMVNAARVRKCRERAALGLITPRASRPIGLKRGTGRGRRRKVEKP